MRDTTKMSKFFQKLVSCPSEISQDTDIWSVKILKNITQSNSSIPVFHS